MAVQLGGDPRWVIDSQLEDWPIVRAVLEHAAQEHAKREAALTRYVAHEAANRTVNGISKVLGDLFDTWAKAQQQ